MFNKKLKRELTQLRDIVYGNIPGPNYKVGQWIKYEGLDMMIEEIVKYDQQKGWIYETDNGLFKCHIPEKRIRIDHKPVSYPVPIITEKEIAIDQKKADAWYWYRKGSALIEQREPLSEHKAMDEFNKQYDEK